MNLHLLSPLKNNPLFKRYLWWFFWTLIFAFPLFIFYCNYKAACFNCHNASDLGIYSQALYKIAAGLDWNPDLSVRGIRIFNDHVDPILLFVAPLVKIFDYSVAGPLLIEALWVWATMIMVLLALIAHYKKIDNSILYLMSLFPFCKGLLVAVMFPIHPTTWSMFPCALLVLAIIKDRPWPIFFAAFFVTLFKEDFPFAIFGLSVAYLLRRDWVKGGGVLFLSILTPLIDFYFRPKILGNTYQYGGPVLRDFLSTPFSPFLSIGQNLLKLPWGTYTIYRPFIIPLVWSIKSEWRELRSWRGMISHPLWPILGFLAPLFVIRLLFQAFQFHYSVPLVVALLTYLGFSSFRKEIMSHPRWAVLVFFLFFITSTSSYTKMVKIVFLDKSPKCLISDQKAKATQELHQKLNSLEKFDRGEEFLMATGGVIPQILNPYRGVYHIGGLSYKLPLYHYLLLEINGSGDLWPVSDQQVQQVIKQCRPMIKNVLIENEFYLLWNGNFPRECLRDGTREL